MLATSKYTKEYIDECRSKVELQMSTYWNMTAKARHLDKTNDRSLHHTIEAFERLFLNNMVLVLDSMFVHRTRAIEGKDDNPLNEVRELCNSILKSNHNSGVSVRLTFSEFEKLSKSFFEEIEKRYL